MARKSHYTYKKFEREKVRQKKKQEKSARKLEAKENKAAMLEQGVVVDPDIAHIVPGPQPDIEDQIGPEDQPETEDNPETEE